MNDRDEYEELLESVYSRLRDGQNAEDISRELSDSGYDRDMIDEILDKLNKSSPRTPEEKLLEEDDEEPVEENLPKKSRWAFFALFFLVFLSLPFILEPDTLVIVYYTSAILVIKGLIYSLIIFSIIKLGDPENNQPYNKIALCAIFITSFSLLPWPVIRLLVIISATVLVFVMFLNISISRAFFFVAVFIMAELFLGFTIVHLEEQLLDFDNDPSKLGLTAKNYCFSPQNPNEYNRNYVISLTGQYNDFCTTEEKFSEKYKTVSCSGEGCFLVEYSCLLLEMKTSTYKCSLGCINGTCIKSD